jgi:2-keto-3-deoxy-L-rhamnonate aldolase RhmA
MSLNNIEKFKKTIQEGRTCVGVPITLSDPTVSELMADAGYDFIWIDMEHAPVDLHVALQHVMAVRGTGTAPFIRVPWNDPVLIKPVLEFEPAGIIVPMIRTATEAELAVKACKYPPVGIRGFGPRRGIKFGGKDMDQYLQEADDRTLVIIQIEHIDAVNNLDEILQVEGLDSICIGPNDLSGSIGRLGQTTHPAVVKMIDTIVAKVKASPLMLGVATGYSEGNAQFWLDRGVNWIALNTDCVNMYLWAKKVVDGVRTIDENKPSVVPEGVRS